MVLEGPARLTHYEGSRTMIYISAKVANDSAFPFEKGEELWVTIDTKGKRLVIERAARGKAP